MIYWSASTRSSVHVLPTYPYPNPTFCPKWEVNVNVDLGEGQAGSFPGNLNWSHVLSICNLLSKNDGISIYGLLNSKYTSRKVNMGAETLDGGGGVTKVIKSYEGWSVRYNNISRGDGPCFTVFRPKSSDSPTPLSPVINNDWSFIACIAFPRVLERTGNQFGHFAL